MKGPGERVTTKSTITAPMGVGDIKNLELTQEADHAAETDTRAQLLATPPV